MDDRKCGSCTKCCEGYLQGNVLGYPLHIGKPCHFVSINKECSVWQKRPENPCRSYQCGWLSDKNIPMWLKPNEVNVIIDKSIINGHTFYRLKESGSIVSSKVLNWFFQYILKNGYNALWEVEGGLNWAGSPEFIQEMNTLYKE